jgi:hypothetical protein
VAFASGMFVATIRDALYNVIALDLNSELGKVAMYTNTDSPNFDADPASYSATNEVSGTGYVAGGNALTGTVQSGSSGILTWDATDAAWTTSTITNARGAKIYADYLTPKALIVAVNFGADYSTVAGTFTIQWNASGITTLDLVP